MGVIIQIVMSKNFFWALSNHLKQFLRNYILEEIARKDSL